MYLSYSGFKSFSSCPRMYWHQYVGKTKLEIPDNKVNSLYGTVVGNLFETFYVRRLWRETGVEARMLSLVDGHYEAAFARENRDGGIRWKADDEKANYSSPEELLEDVRSTVPRGLRIIRHHRLLGPEQSEAEVKLDHMVDGHIIGGRADFLIKRIAPHHDLVLLDGKGSKWRDKYVDPRQLKWYAMLHHLKHGFLPDKLGFVFWKFEPERALDWVDFTVADLLELQNTVIGAMREIDTAKAEGGNELFPVSPGDRCRLCAFRPVCPDGERFVSIRAPVIVGAGVEDVGFNG